eukprot:TRINITY_DN52912_c0_g1_i1.p1 TRINITY_DN52912_c0_g1~~TRINITY_DN52912_c0_g1_i1.p1  ORF type:complete len:311 (-),score=63.31 TRINITY_DN52912_c0_g1_i1:156-1088(-)
MGAALDTLAIDNETKPMLVGIMNGRYKDALILYAKHFCERKDCVSAQITDLDESVLILRHWNETAEEQETPIEYVNSLGENIVLSSAGECRKTLRDMARIAAEALGEDLALPGGPTTDVKKDDGSPSGGYSRPDLLPGSQILNGFIDPASVECLNQDDAHPVTNVIGRFGSEESASLQSDVDVDPQLLIRLNFRQPVHLKALCFKGCSTDGSAPKVVKLFQEQPRGGQDLGFQEAETTMPSQKLELSAADVDESKPVQLRYVCFQNVTALQIFVECNFGAEVTRIEQITFLGMPAEVANIKAWTPGQTPA